MKKGVFLVCCLLIFSLSSCVMFKNLFKKTEAIPSDMQKKVVLSCSDVLPNDLSELIPSNVKNDVDKQTQKLLIKQFIPLDLIEQIIKEHYAEAKRENEFQYTHHLVMESTINRVFEEIQLPKLTETVFLEKEVEKSFFENVKKKLEDKSSEMIFSPELYVYGIDLTADIFFELFHPQIEGSVDVNTSVLVSKNGFELNERELIKEETFESGKKKRVSFDDDADWVLMSLINNPDIMYVRIPTNVSIEGTVFNVELETDFDMDIELTLSFSVNNVDKPIEDGYVWDVKEFEVNKFLLRNTSIRGFDYESNLAEADLKILGNITVGLK